MSEPEMEREQPKKKEVSGIWVLLIFVVLLGIIISLSVMTQ